jgi:hypothetical protein
MQDPQPADRPAATVRAAELFVAVALFLLGAVVVWESRRLGAQWGDDGPQAGYFPFYIGLLICVSSLVVFGRSAFDARRGRRALVTVGQLRMILLLLVPSIVYVALIHVVGMYVASSVFIAFFMVFLGKYSWLKTLPVAIGVSLAFFVLFEVWFKVPLPKGPLEAALGFA